MFALTVAPNVIAVFIVQVQKAGGASKPSGRHIELHHHLTFARMGSGTCHVASRRPSPIPQVDRTVKSRRSNSNRAQPKTAMVRRCHYLPTWRPPLKIGSPNAVRAPSASGTIPIRGAVEAPAEPLFDVPTALVKILNLDLQAAWIPKHDERGRSIDVHAMRHTFGTMLTAAGVDPGSPRRRCGTVPST